MDKLNTSCAVNCCLLESREIADHQFPYVVSGTDVAKAHLQAVDVQKASDHPFILSGDNSSYQHIIGAISLSPRNVRNFGVV